MVSGFTQSSSTREDVPVNQRQQRFFDQLERGIKCKPADIAAKWHVIEKQLNGIFEICQKRSCHFGGAPKAGIYIGGLCD